jgi:hypothetical protein
MYACAFLDIYTNACIHTYTYITYNVYMHCKYMQIYTTLRGLHWLPIQARINFKICLLMYRIYTNCSPAYLSSLVTPCSSLQSRRGLRSSSQGDFVVTRSLKKLGNRAFALAGPTEWNKLPDFIRKSSTLGYRFSKLTLKLICLRFTMIDCAVTRFCARFPWLGAL